MKVEDLVLKKAELMDLLKVGMRVGQKAAVMAGRKAV